MGFRIALKNLIGSSPVVNQVPTHFYTDSHSLVEGIPEPLTSSWDSPYLSYFRELLHQAARSYKIHVHWILGHSGIKINVNMETLSKISQSNSQLPTLYSRSDSSNDWKDITKTSEWISSWSRALPSTSRASSTPLKNGKESQISRHNPSILPSLLSGFRIGSHLREKTEEIVGFVVFVESVWRVYLIYS